MKKIRLTKQSLIVFLVALCLTACAKELPETLQNSESMTAEVKATTEQKETIEQTEKAKVDVVKLTESFYTEYFNQEEDNFAHEGRMGNSERMEVVKRKYLTEDLIEELHIRSRKMGADAITNVQDNAALKGRLSFKEGSDEDRALVTYEDDIGNNQKQYTTIELHFIDVDGKKLADELNTTCIVKEGENEINRYEYKTKWASNGGITEEDRKEMENIKKEMDELEAQGFIG